MTLLRVAALTLSISVSFQSLSAQEPAQEGRAASAVEPRTKADLVSVDKIWSGESDWSSTDLVWYRDHWFCRLQGGPGFNGTSICIIRSKDGRQWQSTARFKFGNFPCSRFAVKDDSQLMLFSASQEGLPGNPNSKLRPEARTSEDGVTWSLLKPNHRDDSLVNGLTWHGDKWWGVASGYLSRRGKLALLTTSDGKAFDEVPSFSAGEGYEPSIGYASHSTVVFANDGKRAYCLVQGRTLSEVTLPLAYLAESDVPFSQWKWKKLDAWLLMPALLRLPDDRLLVAAEWLNYRQSIAFPPESKLTLWQLDPKSGDLKELLVLPSSGTHKNAPAGPGLAWHDGYVWISYWSRTEQKSKGFDPVASSSIYLAKVKLDDVRTSDDTGRPR